jgi:hypothetical protein
VDSGESPGSGTLLGLRSAGSVGALGAGENAARGNDQDVAVRELLLKLAGEADGMSEWTSIFSFSGHTAAETCASPGA